MNVCLSADFVIREGESQKLHLGIRPGSESTILQKNLLYLFDLEPDSFFEIFGMKRIDDPNTSELANAKTVLRFTKIICSLCFTISENRPLMWICSSQAARFYQAALSKNFQFEILRGSLRPDNPYPPLEMQFETGGSNDEHIIRISQK